MQNKALIISDLDSLLLSEPSKLWKCVDSTIQVDCNNLSEQEFCRNA